MTPGGAKNLLADDFCRRWPINNYVELAIKLINKGYIVVISGAKSDEWILPYFSGLNIVNMVGKTDLNQLLYLFSKSDFVVTHDSGPMHLAGMTKCHLIAILALQILMRKFLAEKMSTSFGITSSTHAALAMMENLMRSVVIISA